MFSCATFRKAATQGALSFSFWNCLGVGRGDLERLEEGAVLFDEPRREQFDGGVGGGLQRGTHLLDQAHRALLVLPALDLLAALVVVDPFERQVDLALGEVDAEHPRDDLLAFADVVPDVLDPAGGDLGEVDERLPIRRTRPA